MCCVVNIQWMHVCGKRCVYSANNFAMQHKRKTISGQDVLDAMKEMEFERFVEPLKRSLEGRSSFSSC